MGRVAINQATVPYAFRPSTGMASTNCVTRKGSMKLSAIVVEEVQVGARQGVWRNGGEML